MSDDELRAEVERLRAAIARVGTRCRTIHGNAAAGTTCREVRDSAALAIATGEQPPVGPGWGLLPGTDTFTFTERTAQGKGLCWGCVLADAVEYEATAREAQP